MVLPASSRPAEASVETRLGDALAAGDERLGAAGPVLRHLLGESDGTLFGDRVVSHVRSLLHDLARQFADRLEELPGQAARAEVAQALADAFVANPLLLGHAHAVALETELADRLAARQAIDPVLPPLLEALIASPDAAASAAAMRLLAAQTRFVQAQRRGQLELAELPGDLVHAALITMRTHLGASDPASDRRLAEVERAVRAGCGEGAGRLGLLHRQIAAMGPGAIAALDLAHAGVALFVTALAAGAGQDRDTALLMTTAGQLPRLVLALLGCGLSPALVEQQILALHPDAALPEGFDTLRPDRAAALLAGAGR